MKSIYSYRLKERIYRLAYRLLNDNEEAKDITQDVLEKLLRKKKVTNKGTELDALALKITRDMCFDRLRHLNTKRKQLHSVSRESGHRASGNDYELKDIYVIIEGLVEKLPDKQRIIFRLRDMEELEYDEISELLAMEESSVRMNLSRARKTLREKLIKIQNYGL